MAVSAPLKLFAVSAPTAKCLSGKSTNSEVLFLKIHQLLSTHTVVGGFSDQAL